MVRDADSRVSPCAGPRRTETLWCNLGFSVDRVPRDSYHFRLVPLGATQFCEKGLDGVDDCVGWFNELDFALTGETTAFDLDERECKTCAVVMTGVEPNADLRSWGESTDRGKVVSSNASASEISVSVMD